MDVFSHSHPHRDLGSALLSGEVAAGAAAAVLLLVPLLHADVAGI